MYTTKVLDPSDLPHVIPLHEAYWRRDVPSTEFEDKALLTAEAVPTILEPSLANGLSIALIDEETKKYVGISLNWCTPKEKKEEIDIYFQHMEEGVGEKIEKINPELLEELEPQSKFFMSLWENIDLFELYNVDKILSIGLISVHEEFTRRGICQKLVAESVKRAAECGIGAVRAITVSLFSEKAFQNEGFDIVKDIKFEEYTFQDKHAFNPEAMGVHKRACIQCKLVPGEKCTVCRIL